MELSPLQIARYSYQPKLPEILKNDISKIKAVEGEITASVSDQEEIKKLFPNTYGMREVSFAEGENHAADRVLTVGVILSGGQAPGGHNVITGLYDALKKTRKDNILIGFKNGPSGLLNDDYIVFDDEYIDQFRNTGGFDIIGSGRTKLESEEQFEVAKAVAEKHALDAVVIIGGDDSNTNAAVLAEYFKAHGSCVQVIGCPKTIDGDLKNDVIEISFGFDTATKTYSELIGNIERDANSAKKYWHFVRVMGRSASHIALECALQTQPNICFISEEVEQKKMSLSDIADQIVSSIVKRSENGENFGVAIIPEGLIEFVPEVKKLISELNDLMALKQEEFNALTEWEDKYSFMEKNLTKESFAVFSILPIDIEKQLLMDRDPHGNVQVSRIETEKLLISIVETKLKKLKEEGKTLDELAEIITRDRLKFCHNFTVNDLFHLHRGGRVSKMTAVVGMALGIKPLLHVDDAGHLINVGKTRGRKAALTWLVDKMGEKIGNNVNDAVYISHSDCYDDAKFVADLVKERFGIQNILIGDIGQVIGSHTGIGTVALFFIGDSREV